MTKGASAPEFARPIRLDMLGAAPRTMTIAADEGERAGLAARFGLLAIDALAASAALTRDGEAVLAEGRLTARATQACVATGESVPADVSEDFALRFVPAIPDAPEVELEARDLDIVPYEGGAIDLGEAVAQGFALALPLFPRAPVADAHLSAAGVLSEEAAEAARREAGPFAVLKALTSSPSDPRQ